MTDGRHSALVLAALVVCSVVAGAGAFAGAGAAADGAETTDASTSETANETIEGTVTGPDGETIPNVTVGAWNGSAYAATDWTGATGTYNLSVPNGSYALLTLQSNESGDVSYPTDGVADIYAVPENVSAGETYDVTLPAVTNRQVRVTDDAGTPIANATVQLRGDGFYFTTETNADGYAVPPGATESGVEFAGNATVRVWPPDEPGLDSYVTGAIAADADATTVVVERQPYLRGQFVSASGEPVSNVSSVIAYGESDWAFGEANASGNFTVTAPNGTYELGFEQDPATSADGVPDLVTLGNVTVDGATDLGTVTVPDANRVTATVVNRSGANVSGVPVVADLADASSIRLGETDADGRVGVEVANETELVVDSPWYNYSEATVGGTQNASVTLAVEPRVPVNVSVERADGSSVESLDARMERVEDDGGYHASTTSLDDGVGQFSVEPGARWNYGVVQRFDGYPLDGVPDVYAVANRSAPLDSGATVSAVVPDAHRLNLTVTGSNGAPVANEGVVVASTRNGSRVTVEGHTDDEGRLVVGGTPGVEVAGTVTVGLGTQFWDPERFDANWTFDVTNNTTASVTAASAVTSAASGRLVGADGDPVANVSDVTLAGEETYRGDVSDDGNFTVTAPNGTYALGFEQDGAAGADGVPDLGSLGNVTVDGQTDLGNVTVPAPSEVTVSVVNESGPVSGVRLIAHTTAPPHATVTLGETNASGQVVVETLNETAIAVEDVRYNDSEATVSGAQDASVTLPVERHAIVTMNVTRPDGSPATGMAAQVQYDGGWHASDLDDGRERFGVPPNESRSYGVAERYTDYPLNGVPDVYAVANRSVSLPGATIDATVPDAHRLNLTVTNATGDPVANEGVVVASTRNGARITIEGHTDDEGRLVVGGTPGVEVAGTVTVGLGTQFWDPERFDANWTFDVTNDTTVSVSAAATDHVTVNGTLTSAGGSVASTDRVVAIEADTRDVTDTSALSANGTYSVAVPNGTTHHLRYYEDGRDAPSHDGSPDVYALGTVTPTENVTVNGTLPLGHVLNVTVVNESDAVVPDARVAIANATTDRALLDQPVDAAGRLNVSASGTPGVEVANGTYHVGAVLENDTSVVAQTVTNVTVAGDAAVTLTLDTTPASDGGDSDGDSSDGGDGSDGSDDTTEPANLTVVDAARNATSATVNDDVVVNATVANTGDENGSTTLVLTRDGDALAQQTVAVEAGATRTVTFERTLVEDGAHTFAVNGTTAGTVDVSLQRLGGTSAGSPGFGVLVGALAVVAATLVVRRRD